MSGWTHRSAAALMALGCAATSTQGQARDNGRDLFQQYCVRCHGANADGESELGKLLSPRPANLRTSRLPSTQIAEIIKVGGAALGRSASMPAWGDQISSLEVGSLVQYVDSVRVRVP